MCHNLDTSNLSSIIFAVIIVSSWQIRTLYYFVTFAVTTYRSSRLKYLSFRLAAASHYIIKQVKRIYIPYNCFKDSYFKILMTLKVIYLFSSTEGHLFPFLSFFFFFFVSKNVLSLNKFCQLFVNFEFHFCMSGCGDALCLITYTRKKKQMSHLSETSKVMSHLSCTLSLYTSW